MSNFLIGLIVGFVLAFALIFSGGHVSVISTDQNTGRKITHYENETYELHRLFPITGAKP